jgi:hypothetical protein
MLETFYKIMETAFCWNNKVDIKYTELTKTVVKNALLHSVVHKDISQLSLEKAVVIYQESMGYFRTMRDIETYEKSLNEMRGAKAHLMSPTKKKEFAKMEERIEALKRSRPECITTVSRLFPANPDGQEALLTIDRWWKDLHECVYKQVAYASDLVEGYEDACRSVHDIEVPEERNHEVL